MAEKTTQKAKDRFFTFLLYPESLPEDWLMKLELLGVPMAISPLHDKDKAEVKGEVFKKPHYHVLYIANNHVTADSVRRKVQRALGKQALALVQIIDTTVENCYLYQTHESKDAIDKKKHVYDKKDRILLNNFDIDRYISESIEDKEALYNLICDLIDDYQLCNIRELRRFIKARGDQYGIRSMRQVNAVLRSHTGLIRLYFDASYQEKIYGERPLVDPKTGEVITPKPTEKSDEAD